MFLFPFLGFWLRFIFVYFFNWKKMDQVSRENKELEKYKNVKVGAIGFVLITAGFILYQISI